MTSNFSLILHGGAGALEHIKREGSVEQFTQSLRRTLMRGRRVLEKGGAAVDAVELCAALLEDDPLYNAGRGSVLNEFGLVEMDAAIMDGRDLSAGAVAGIHNIKNPSCLARQVMDRSEHVMLISKGAMEFATQACGMELMPDDYFIVESRVRQWKEAQEAGKMMLDHEDVNPMLQRKLGTIGAVARDINGNLAAATSTGGIVNKRWGRVGDSPVVGAGVFADNDSCAVSATGYGEQFLRTVLSKTISDLVHFQGLNAKEAAKVGIDYLVSKVNGMGGVIVVDKDGQCAVGHSTSGMIYGWIENGGETFCSLS
ncbi:MAG: isoaspartyl peptidase/L-asparaginase family protein [Synechococcus sp.]